VICACGVRPIFAGLSILACNLINNQPMTIAFTRILLHDTFSAGVGPVVQRASTFAVILGSNLGANFTLIGLCVWCGVVRCPTHVFVAVGEGVGSVCNRRCTFQGVQDACMPLPLLTLMSLGALAGVMWVKILQHKGLTVSYLQFLKHGLVIMTPVAMASLLTLYAVIR
jgi:Na+/H+ antiporter NhaD/arsenite permease-like protein